MPRARAAEVSIEAKLIEESRRVRTPWTIALTFALLATPVVAKSTKDASKDAAKSPPAPAFSLPGLQGDVSLASLRGKTVLVDFWASWCGPCRQSFPWMNDMQHRYGAKGLAIVAVNLDKDRESANTFLSELPATFTVVFDPAGATAERYHVKALPTTFLVSPDGRVLATHTGFDAKRAPEFEARIAEALPR